jgi:hypothetical protein
MMSAHESGKQRRAIVCWRIRNDNADGETAQAAAAWLRGNHKQLIVHTQIESETRIEMRLDEQSLGGKLVSADGCD